MDRADKMNIIAQALTTIERQPVPNQCTPVANGQLGLSWLWHTPERRTTIVRVHYQERQREQDGPLVGFRVPLANIAVHHLGEWIPLAEQVEDKTHLLSFDTSRPYHLTEIAGLTEALNDALSVPLRV